MAPHDCIHTALRDHAVPLPSIDEAKDVVPDDKTKLLEDISNCLSDSQIVGLGEATHGTRECFVHKARLIRYLVAERGFRTVAFEADAAAARTLDAFVQGDVPVDASVDAATDTAVLAELDMWQWQTEAVGDLLTWLREFNAGREREEQVRVRGVDLSTPAVPAAPLREYFEQVDPDVTERETFETIAESTVPERGTERERALDAVSAAAKTLAQRLEANRASYAATTSEAAWAQARHFCRVVEQATEWARIRHEQPGPHPEGMATRDRFMAENALWALEQDPGAGVALWAHDGHVQRGTFDDGSLWAETMTMGERLAGDLGDAYRPVGFDFDRGSFRAVGAESGEIGTYGVGEPMEGSATAAFAAIDKGPYALDLGAAAADTRLRSWFAEECRTRYVGSVFDPEGGDETAYARTDLPASYDWLVFVPESTPTRPLDGG